MFEPTGHTPPIRIASGAVIGEWDQRSGVAQFRGIPFSTPIAGENRFRPVQAASAWRGTHFATEWPHPVPQMSSSGDSANDHHFGSYFAREQSEGPLTLNLWTSSFEPAAGMPVVVWFHGGGLTSGEPTRPRESGHQLARKGVVVVSPTHRLGALGYLHLHGLAPDRYPAVSPGVADLILSLVWVRDNVAQFGGDPLNVTIMGESGGAAKVHALLGSHRARQLFNRAVMLGGGTPDRGAFTQSTPASATELARSVVESLGLTGSTLDDIRSLPARRLIEIDEAAQYGADWHPVVDGDILPKPTWKAMRTGEVDIPTIIGSSRYEADIFGLSTEAALGLFAHALSAEEASRLLDHYRRSANEREAVIAFTTDCMFRIPGILVAEDLGQSALSKTFQYLFDYSYGSKTFPHFRATHGSETPFIFGTTQDVEITRDDETAAQLAEAVQDSFLEFFRTGAPGVLRTPNGDSVPWSPYDVATRETMLIRRRSAVLRDPQRSNRLAWTPILSSH